MRREHLCAVMTHHASHKVQQSLEESEFQPFGHIGARASPAVQEQQISASFHPQFRVPVSDEWQRHL